MDRKEYKKQWRIKNKDWVKHQRHNYYLENKEEIKNKSKNYREQNMDYYKDYNQEYYLENKEEIKNKSKNYREQNKDYNKQWKKEYREKNKERLKNEQKEYNQNLKKLVLTHYSFGDKLKCNNCGYDDIRALSIDHINNDGAKHRKEIGRVNIYCWLKNNNFPEGFQTLCMNCQFIKRFGDSK